MERLSWMFSLFDRMSGPADRIGKSLKRLHGTQLTLNRGFGDMGRKMLGPLEGFVHLGPSAASTLGALGAVGGALSTVAIGAGVVAAGLGAAVLALDVYGIKTMATRESLMKSFELMTGSADEANKFFRSAVDFAAITPFETQDVVNQYKRLLAAGFKQEEVPIVFQAVGDVAAMNEFSSATMNSITRAFGQMKGRGKLLTEELYQVLEGSNGAIRRAAVFENIAKNLGIGVNEVQDAISGGRVDADTGIFSILQAIRDTTSGGELGKGMEMQADTINGIFSTLKSIPADLFYRMDLTQIPGFDAFKGFLINLRSLFDLTSADGKRLMATVQAVFGESLQGAFGWLSGPQGMERLQSGLRSVLEGVNYVWAAVKGLAKGAQAFWDALSPALDALMPAKDELGNLLTPAEKLTKQMTMLGTALGSIAGALVRIATPFQQVSDLFSKATGMGEGLGGSITSGLAQGLWKYGDPISATKSLFGDIYDMASGPEGIDAHSPSRKFEYLGEMSTEGYAKGLAKGGGLATAVEMPRTGSAGSHGAPQVTVTLSIDARGNSAAEEIGRLVEHLVPTAITRAFEQLALGGGVAEEPAT